MQYELSPSAAGLAASGVLPLAALPLACGANQLLSSQVWYQRFSIAWGS
jgi:hypothetical protein